MGAILSRRLAVRVGGKPGGGLPEPEPLGTWDFIGPGRHHHHHHQQWSALAAPAPARVSPFADATATSFGSVWTPDAQHQSPLPLLPTRPDLTWLANSSSSSASSTSAALSFASFLLLLPPPTANYPPSSLVYTPTTLAQLFVHLLPRPRRRRR
ncbi:hypothetical protein BC567DRAFT_27269 [Phyllosticta citribraziliensis]